MPLEGQRKVFRRNAAAVIADPYQVEAAPADLDRYLTGTRVEGVLYELLYDGGGPFDNLAGGDLADDVRRQLLDRIRAVHGRHSSTGILLRVRLLQRKVRHMSADILLSLLAVR